LIRVHLTVRDGRLVQTSISGDFFMYPEDSLWNLERALEGCEAKREEVEEKVQAFYRESGAVTPGVRPQDFAEAVAKALTDSLKADQRPSTTGERSKQPALRG